MLSMKGALQEKKEMILVTEKTEALKVEKGMILSKKNHGEDEDAAKEPSHAFDKCNLAQEVNCNLPELAPMKCQKHECDKLVHHLCQSEWEQREGRLNTVAMYCCLYHPNYIYKTQSETYDGSQGTERIDSAQDKSDASVAQHGTGSINKDGGTETHTTPSADHELDAIESSIVSEKGGDLAEENCEHEDNINGAGKGGVVDEGGNGVNEDANPQNYQGDGDGESKHQKE
jgi:hypothetical protein